MTGLQRALLGWSAAAMRDLPWRRTREPWAVLVSESIAATANMALRLYRHPQLQSRERT